MKPKHPISSWTLGEAPIAAYRVMPGFRGTPAGMMTMSAPVKAFFKPSSVLRYPLTLAGVEMWERSAATPGVFTISNNASWGTVTWGKNQPAGRGS